MRKCTISRDSDSGSRTSTAVSGDGEVFVGYQARLEFRQLLVQGASFLLSPQRGSGRGASTWTRAPSPESGSSGIRWSVPRLGVRETWTATGAAIPRRLFHSNEGMVDWKGVDYFLRRSRISVRSC